MGFWFVVCGFLNIGVLSARYVLKGFIYRARELMCTDMIGDAYDDECKICDEAEDDA